MNWADLFIILLNVCGVCILCSRPGRLTRAVERDMARFQEEIRRRQKGGSR